MAPVAGHWLTRLPNSSLPCLPPHTAWNASSSGMLVTRLAFASGLSGKVDVLFHIGRRMRSIALQSAVGGMALSVAGMLWAATGHLPPVAGAVIQEVIDLLAVLNALRAAIPPRVLSDY